MHSIDTEFSSVVVILILCILGINLCACVCVLGAGESGESVKACIYSAGGGQQHQAAQRPTEPAHTHWILITAQ